MSISLTIGGFAALQPGWHLGTGVAPPANRIGLAIMFASFIQNYCEISAFPGSDGEILLKGYWKNERVELTFESDNTYTLVHEIDGEDELYESRISLALVSIYLTQILAHFQAPEECQLSSALLIQPMTMIQKTENALISPLKTEVNPPPSPVLKRSVQRYGPDRFAPIYANTTAPLPSNRVFTGNLSQQNFQMEAA